MPAKRKGSTLTKKEETEDAPPLKLTRSTSSAKKSEIVVEQSVKIGRKSISKKDSEKKKGKKSEPIFEEVEEKRIVKVIKKGKAPVDSVCPQVKTVHVYCDKSGIYDAMLNQTNLQFNNNKFYILQLLEDDNSKKYHVWFRWGRVGKVGQSKLESFTNLDNAKSSFCKKFTDKTKNDWNDRHAFVKVPGKYDLLQMDYDAPNEESEKESKNVKKDKKKEEESDIKSKLLPAIQKLITFMCDLTLMEETVMEMKYDTKKAPLGRLTKAQIKAGYEALKRIDEILFKNGRRADVVQACNDFYTRIPHDFGMRTPPVISCASDIKKKMELLEALQDIEIAMQVMNKPSLSEHPIDRNYNSLGCEIKAVPRSDFDNRFQMISLYLQRTHAPTHKNYNMSIEDIYEVYKSSEHEQFKDVGNRRLLWHGSRLSNWMGILTQGLRIAPPEAPSTGYMFGKGVYFADVSSKSANYLYPTRAHDEGLLVLCEVALGKCNELLAASSTANNLPKDKHSVKGMGQMEPDPTMDETLPDGVVVPWGTLIKTKTVNPVGYTLNYNEYIVYDIRQIKMRYLVRVKFHFC